MANNNIKEKLVKLLTTIFQFDTEDLDFGIYKILNYKKKEIAEFINKDLIEEINKQLKLIGSEEQKKQQAELEKLKKQLIDLGVEDYENNPKYQEKKNQLENIKVSKELEKQIYNHIYAFFSRYYDRGDFISKRRYGKNEKYAIPYNGEETLLYWANNDQYYVKTTESFRKFSFKIPGLKVNFRVVEAEEDNGNVKVEESRYFIVSSKNLYDLDKNELNIYFEFRALTNAEKKEYPKPNQEQINEDNIKVIQKSLEKGSKAKELFKEDEKGKTLLSKNLNKYTKRNTSDYFIHKDLKAFLERELDFYIKNEVVDLSDVTQLDVEHFNRYILEVKVLGNICNKIIDFLVQIENFQKKLWEKKKFVLKTDYCITLDYIDEKYYPEILKNKEQLEEWKKLYSFDIKEQVKKLEGTLKGHGDGNKEIEVLKQNPTLMLDTKFFNEEFKFKLLEEIEVSDEKINGILINSENYQALRLILEKYRNKVKCCYIDPPFNTGGSEFIYKNAYRHSSWLTMMENRLRLSKEFVKQDGVHIVAIDDFEVSNLGLLLENIFSPENFLGELVIEIKPSGRTNDYFFSTSHEYAYFFANSKDDVRINFIELSDKQKAEYKFKDKISRYKWRDFLRTGGYSTPAERPNSYYSIYYNEETRDISLEPKKGYIEILPLDSKNQKRVWRKTKPSLQDHMLAGDIRVVKKNNGDFKVEIKDREKKGIRPKALWVGSKYDASSYGSKLLKNIIPNNPFSFPKSLYTVKDCLRTVVDYNSIIIDYFAGSGTTGHAVLKRNKEDEEAGL